MTEHARVDITPVAVQRGLETLILPLQENLEGAHYPWAPESAAAG